VTSFLLAFRDFLLCSLTFLVIFLRSRVFCLLEVSICQLISLTKAYSF
jgi:hypothetical protein